MGPTAPPRPTPYPKAVAYFRRHPLLLLLCFSPGIPEYLSGSTPLTGLVRSPVVFLLFLALNVALYGPGVLLVREALVRWRKGWASVLCLGAAYGTLEEGTALSTLFNPKASVVGGLGFYGHSLGVNWVWAIGVLQIHIVFSIGLPILLLGLALPETRGRPFLDRRGIGLALAILALDVVFLAAIVHYYPVDLLLLILSVAVAGGLVALAYRLPRTLLGPTTDLPRFGPGAFFVLGLAFFPILLVIPGLGEAGHIAAPITGGVELAFSGGLFLAVRSTIGRSHHAPELVMLALGALVPIAFAGIVSQLYLPVVLVPDVLFAMFFYSLWCRYGTAEGGPAPGVPVGAT
jgi:hypothetical protein